MLCCQQLFNPNAGDSQLPRSDDDEEEDVESLIAKLPVAYGSQLVELHHMSRGCVLLLLLKQHLKDAYGFTDRYWLPTMQYWHNVMCSVSLLTLAVCIVTAVRCSSIRLMIPPSPGILR